MNKIETLLKEFEKEKKEEAIKLYKLGILNGSIIFGNNVLDFLSAYDNRCKDDEDLKILSPHLRIIAEAVASINKNIKDKYESGEL